MAALYVQPDGVFAGLDGVEVWDEARDARRYAGPWPVVAHPPCARWGRYHGGAPKTWPRLIKGDDDGCFAAALAAVRRWGGVLEHPAHSAAWLAHGLPWPAAAGGWQQDILGAWCCHVEQGHYGHMARKPTWLLAVDCELPSLRWGAGPQRLPEYAVARYGRAKASRIGMLATLSSKDPRRAATPVAFRDVLLAMARSVQAQELAA